MSENPFQYFEVISQKSDIDLDPNDFNSFLINRALSYFPDTVLFAQELNERSGMPPNAQFFYLKNLVSKKIRRSKWTKKDETFSSIINILQKKYQTSETNARQILKLLNKKQIEEIEKEYSNGGIRK